MDIEANWTIRLFRLPLASSPWWALLLAAALYISVTIMVIIAGGISSNKKKPLLSMMLAFVLLLWIGLPITGILSAYWPGISEFFNERPILLFGPAYNLLDSIASPNTSFVLWMMPVVLIFLIGDKPFPLKSAVMTILITSFIFEICYLLLFLIDVAVTNPLSVLYFGLIAWTVNSLNVRKLQENYDITKLRSGIKFRIRKEDGNPSVSAVSTVILFCIFSAFYFNLQISSDFQIAYYASLLSGLLAILGVLGLIFTFTFEMLDSSHNRRSIADDTKSSQSAISVLLGLSIVGFFVADETVVFDIRDLNSENFVRLTVFSLSVVGGAFAIQYTMTFFHRIVDFVVNSSGIQSESSLVYHFAEMNTPVAEGSISTGPNGLSQMRSYIEEGGNQVHSIESSSNMALRRLRNSVIVVPRTSKTIEKSVSEQLLSFAERGNILVILTDQLDASHKAHILGGAGIDVLPVPSQLVRAKNVPLEVHGALVMDEIGHFRALLDDVVPLSVANPYRTGAANDADNAASTPQLILFAIASYGRGAVVAVGGISQWTNKSINVGDNILFLDYLQAVIRRVKDPSAPPLFDPNLAEQAAL